MRSIVSPDDSPSDPRCDRVISIATWRRATGLLSAAFRGRRIERSSAATDERRCSKCYPRLPFPCAIRSTGCGSCGRSARPALTGVPGATLRIGGIPALNADYQTIVDNQFVSVMALVVGGTLLALLVGFRSLFVAVKAIALNLLSVAASFGALVLVFQDGHGSAIFRRREGTGSVFPLVPIVTFAIVFGLSMDYEVFLVARVLEARRSGLREMEAIPEGLARTAGLITSAAAIMIVVFAAFTFGNFLVVKMIGFTLAVAVLIDATLVRIVIGPALLRVAGDWNWWPGGLAQAPEREP